MQTDHGSPVEMPVFLLSPTILQSECIDAEVPKSLDFRLMIIVLWSECLCAPPHSYIGILMPNVMVLGSAAFGGD